MCMFAYLYWHIGSNTSSLDCYSVYGCIGVFHINYVVA